MKRNDQPLNPFQRRLAPRRKPTRRRKDDRRKGSVLAASAAAGAARTCEPSVWRFVLHARPSAKDVGVHLEPHRGGER